MASIIKVDQIQTAAGGTPTAADLGITGSVIQVVRGTYGTEVESSSSSYADTGLSVDITVKDASSTIYGFITAPMQLTKPASNQDVGTSIKVLRDSTAVYTPATSFENYHFFNNTITTNTRFHYTNTFADTHGQTKGSTLTYKTQFNSYNTTSGVHIRHCFNSNIATLMLIEIAG